jgi:hypothetical protein
MQTLKYVYNDSVLPVVENGMAIMFDNGYSLDDCLTVVPAPGHTPGTCALTCARKSSRRYSAVTFFIIRFMFRYGTGTRSFATIPRKPNNRVTTCCRFAPKAARC